MLATSLSKITPATLASTRSLDKYQEDWNFMVIREPMIPMIISAAKLILKFKKTFELAVMATEIPWYLAGIIYYREEGCQFKGHPHNGNSLKRRTVNVPAGRPLKSPLNPAGYTFLESFRDLIQLKKWEAVPEWDMPSLLYYLETFNGTGYRTLKKNPPIPTPYLWSGTTYYEKGKFSSDHGYDPNLVDKQIGAAPLLKFLTDRERGLVN
jgi:lysozyme family protein